VLFSIRELEVKKIPFEADFRPGEIEFEEHSLRQVSDLHSEGVAELLSNTLGEVRVHGNLRVTMEADCDRCLDPARVPVSTDFDLFYRPALEEGATSHHHQEVALDEGEAEMGFYEGAGIELKDVLREQILLALPMQFVCSDACKGICPTCGKNRNTGQCQCEERPADDRWLALRDLKSGS
jgi:uncharacterized protein